MSYGFEQLRHLWISAGGPSRVADKMAAISLAESGGGKNPLGDHYASQGYTSWGLWQIHTRNASACLVNTAPDMHPYDEVRLVTDPMYNAHAAVAVYHSQGLGAWSTYQNGAYRKFLPRVYIAHARSKATTHRIAAAPRKAAHAHHIAHVVHHAKPVVIDEPGLSPSSILGSAIILLVGCGLWWRLACEAKRALAIAVREEIIVRRRAARRRQYRDNEALRKRMMPRTPRRTALA